MLGFFSLLPLFQESPDRFLTRHLANIWTWIWSLVLVLPLQKLSKFLLATLYSTYHVSSKDLL
jgi:hypothetical protein